jgi:hypothetical protein
MYKGKFSPSITNVVKHCHAQGAELLYGPGAEQVFSAGRTGLFLQVVCICMSRGLNMMFTARRIYCVPHGPDAIMHKGLNIVLVKSMLSQHA